MATLKRPRTVEEAREQGRLATLGFFAGAVEAQGHEIGSDFLEAAEVLGEAGEKLGEELFKVKASWAPASFSKAVFGRLPGILEDMKLAEAR
jgi:hypothetical protein